MQYLVYMRGSYDMFPKLAAKALRNGGALLIWYGSRYSKTSERNGHGPFLHRCGDDDRHGDSVSFSELFLGAEAVSGIRSFVRRNVVMFQMKTVQMEPNPEGAASANRQQKNPDAVLDYLQHSLSADGKAGSFVFVGRRLCGQKIYTDTDPFRTVQHSGRAAL